MAASLSIAVWAAIGNDAAITVSLIQLGLLIFTAQRSALEITLTKGWLLVGPAAIERAFIHNFKALDFKQMIFILE